MQIRGTINRVELVGWIGDEPEQRTFATGTKVCSFSIATKRLGSRNDQGQRQVETDWTSIEAWEKLGERCVSSLHKGSRVYISGSLHTRSWEDREHGQRRYRTVVRADSVLFLDARPDHDNESEEIEAEESEEVPF